MLSKSWNELRAYDISKHIKTRDGFSYLPWSSCVLLLHQLGAEKVLFTPCVNSNGSSLFMSDQVFTDKNKVTNRCYEVKVRVEIDDLSFEVQYPLMNGSNPVKDNSMSQQRVWNAQTRAFVKGVALYTGLGFDLWLNDVDADTSFDDLERHDILKIKERVQREYTYYLKVKRMSVGEIAEKIGMTNDEVKEIFNAFGTIYNFERKLLNIQ